MTRKTFYIIISTLFLLFLIQHVLIKQPDLISKVTAAEDFSDIEIELLDGGFEPIGYYEGNKRVLLIFWTSTSDPCLGQSWPGQSRSYNVSITYSLEGIPTVV